MTRRPLFILRLGSTVPTVAALRGDFDDWIADGLGLPESNLRRLAIHEGDALPDPSAVGAVVLSGSSAMVTEREAWSERTARWLVPVAGGGTPVLGICYGHQLLAHAFGGVVGDNPRGREIGTVRVELDAAGDELLGDLPSPIVVQATHVQSVLALPAGATVLGRNDADPHHVFRLGERAWGVQFHPEFDGEIIRGYLAERSETLLEEGLDPEALTRAAQDSDHGTRVLRRFGEIAA